MQRYLNVVREKKGFTLIEMILIIMIIGVMVITAVPSFIRSARRSGFEKVVASVITLIEQARTQALASEMDIDHKIPPGGYGVYFDLSSGDPLTDQKAVLFVDDWNDSFNGGTRVKMDYGSVADQVIYDGIFTAGDGKDTVIEEVAINDPQYIRLNSLLGVDLDGDDWTKDFGSDDTLTLLFKPPYAEATAVFNDGVNDLKSFEAEFELTTENSLRTIRFNRVTTTPEVILGGIN